VSEKPGRDLTLGDIHDDHNALENLQGYVAELVLKIQALEAKAKEPEIVFRSGGADDPPKPSGWRARKFKYAIQSEGEYRPTMEIHPRAVRVRFHRTSSLFGGRWVECDCKNPWLNVEHMDTLQISSEPAVK
jgi:hypothetical protein